MSKATCRSSDTRFKCTQLKRISFIVVLGKINFECIQKSLFLPHIFTRFLQKHAIKHKCYCFKDCFTGKRDESSRFFVVFFKQKNF